jgi:MoaA/NifB/PqqE/SkfB family radical SAM enzyme
VAFHPFLLVPTGRGKELADQELSPQQYEETLNWVYDQRDLVSLNLKPTCAPHYLRVLRQRAHAEGKNLLPRRMEWTIKIPHLHRDAPDLPFFRAEAAW